MKTAVSILQEGQLYSILWNEPDVFKKRDKVLTEIYVTPELSFRVFSKHETSATGNAKQSVQLTVSLMVNDKDIRESPITASNASIIIYATKDGDKRQMYETQGFSFWTTYWDNQPSIDKAALFELLIDFGTNLAEKKSSASYPVIQKMFADRTLADVTFKFPGNIAVQNSYDFRCILII